MKRIAIPAPLAACLWLLPAGCADPEPMLIEQPIHDEDEDAWPDGEAHPQVVRIFTTGSCTAWLAASNVIVTAAHCLDGDVVTDGGGPVYDGAHAFAPVDAVSVVPINTSGPAAAALAALTPVEPEVLAHPAYFGGYSGSDLAVAVYPEEAALPRKLLRPMKVARLEEEPDERPIALGGGRTGQGCDGPLGEITALRLEPGLGDDENDMPTVEFDHDDSHPCGGDSGAPIVSPSTDQVLAGLAAGDGGDGDDDIVGPPLWMKDGAARTWLRAVALDRDQDGLEAHDDNCDMVANQLQADVDQDGVGDVCDVCPHVADDQVDGDGDGVPDCADPCPDDPVELVRPCKDDDVGDSDCDGVCDSADSCPFRANAQIANDNALTEELLGADVVGDECEPVPVPQGAAGAPHVVATYTHAGSVLVDVFRHVIRDQIAVRPQPSHHAPDHTVQASPVVPGQPIQTHFRFCQEDPAASSGCTDFENLGDAQLHLGIQAIDETPAMRWHRVKMGFSVQRGASTALTYDGAETVSTWSYAADGAFWISPASFDPPLIDLPPPEQTTLPIQPEPYVAGAYSGLRGTFWLHGATTIGHPGHDIGTGVHPGGEGEALSNHYFAIDPEEIEHSVHTRPQQDRFFFLRLTLPDPARWRDGLDLVAHEGLILVDTVADQWGVLNPDGSAQLATEHLSSALRASLEDATLVWASASEPSFHIGASDAPVAAAVSADGATVKQIATASADGQSFEGQIHGGPHVAGGARAAAGPFALALSRLHRSLYRIGPRGEIARAVLERDRALPWVSMATTLAVGAPLAAVVSFRDRGLYVLDQIERDRQPTVRLLRYDALRGGGVELAAFARSADADQIWLELDRDGQLLVAQSSVRRRRHALFRIEVDRRQIRATSWQQGEGALAYPPLVDGAGYAFYRPVGERLEGARTAALSLRSCPLAQLASPF